MFRLAALAGLGLLLVGCTDRSVFAEWPGQGGDLVLLFTFAEGRTGVFLGAYADQPSVQQTIESDERLLAVIVSAEDLRSIHYAVDTSPEALNAVTLEATPNSCVAEVSSDGKRIVAAVPPGSLVVELGAESGFSASGVPAEFLLDERSIAVPLGVEPCRPNEELRPFEVVGPLVVPDEINREFDDISRLGDVIFATTRKCLYVYERGQPMRCHRAPAPLRSIRFTKLAVHRTGEGEGWVVAGHGGGGQPREGGISWWRWSGGELTFFALQALDVQIVDVAVSLSGRIVGVTPESDLIVATVTSSTSERVTVTGIADLRTATFDEAGELLVATPGSVARVSLIDNRAFDTVELVDVAGVPANSPVRAMVVFGEEVFAATHSRGLFRAQPGEQTLVMRFIPELANPRSVCLQLRLCGGYDYSFANHTLVLMPGPAPRVVLSHSDCDTILVYDPVTGCTADIVGPGRQSALHANTEWLTVGDMGGLLELPSLAFAPSPAE